MKRLTVQVRPVYMALATVALVAGCAHSSRVEYYTLSTVSPPSEQSPSDVVVGVGPIAVPAYLRQSAMVTRIDSNTLYYNDFRLWAEPLEDAIPQIISTNLQSLLQTQRMELFPWRTSAGVTHQLKAEVLAFELMPGGDAVLSLRWHLTDSAGNDLGSGTETSRHDAGGDPRRIAGALSLALNDVCQVIAEQVRRRP